MISRDVMVSKVNGEWDTLKVDTLPAIAAKLQPNLRLLIIRLSWKTLFEVETPKGSGKGYRTFTP